MKRRVRKIANFFAFNLLFFALYLNFIHKDKAQINFTNEQATAQQPTAAFSGTVAVEQPETKSGKADEPKADQAALKLSIN